MTREKITLSENGWIVVADGGKALFLRNEGDRQFPNLAVFRVEENEGLQNRELASDRPGRLPDAGAEHMSAVEATDRHELAETQFAVDLANVLYEYAQKGEFGELILVATPSTLGAIRGELHQEVSGRIVGEIAKDLTNHPISKIGKIVLG